MSHPANGLHRALVSIFAFSVSILTVAPAVAQGLLPDVGKGAIERPLKSLIKGTPSAYPAYPVPAPVPIPVRARGSDMGKMGIESPIKNLIRKSSIGASVVAESNKAGRTSLAELEDENLQPGKVKPGLVVWHSTFQKAMAASARSGKPVFLFHMMGRLDDRFC